MEYVLKVAGQAGAGVMTTGRMLIMCFTRGGYNVVGYPEYPSLIRGGHNTVQVRISDKPINAPVSHQDLLVALNKDAVFYHMKYMSSGGTIIYEEGTDLSKIELRDDVNMYAVPLMKLTKEAGGSHQMKNTTALGVALGLIGYPFEIFEGVLKDHFGKKKEEIANANIACAKAGYEFVKEKIKEIKPLSNERKLLVTGNQAIALGAIGGGMKFYAAYPMTPASSILHYLAKLEREFELVVKQTEDEIAAINYALGASFAGARSMVGTSGGGFSLMVESVGLSGLSETPVVITIAQRVGPSTGMPTWTEQADLKFVLSASQGEFPRAVLAPGDVQEAFTLTAEAHNIAERYQMPVFVLSDKFLSESVFSTEPFPKVEIDRGKIVEELPELPKMSRWTRYALTEDGISPRAFPGTKNGVHVATSYEHDETGFSSESFIMRVKQADKRFKKLEILGKHIPGPKIYGEGDVALVCWGSVKLSAVDTLEMLKKKGINAKVVQITHIYPLNKDAFLKAIEGTKPIIIENNATAQLAGYLKEQCGFEPVGKILRYDGRPFFPENIVEKVEKILEGSKKEVVKEEHDLEYYYPYKYQI